MNALARFEGFMQTLMDRRVVRLLGGKLQPVELAQAMARCMEAHCARSAAGPEAPNYYRLLIHPDDYADLRLIDADLERSLTQYAIELARERGFNFPGPPHVSVAADHEVERATVRVEAESVRSAAAERGAPPWERRSARKAATGAPVYFEVPGAESTLPLDRFPFAIGRRPGHDLVLPDPRVSRDHAVIEQLDGRFRLRDLGSRNGTFLNGQPVSEADLRDGDRLAIGAFEVTVRIPR
jgi:hypothetical protein